MVPLLQRRAPREHVPSSGDVLITFVEGPFGSAARTDWIEYSSVLFMADGSGVSFELPVPVFERTTSKHLGDSRSLSGERLWCTSFGWLANFISRTTFILVLDLTYRFQHVYPVVRRF